MRAIRRLLREKKSGRSKSEQLTGTYGALPHHFVKEKSTTGYLT